MNTNTQLSIIIKRFQTLYPRLLKNQSSVYHGGAKPLTVHDQIKLCKSLAKSESIALLTEESKQNIETLKALEVEISTIMQKDLDFSKGQGSQELFTIFLYMYAQYKSAQPAKGFLDLIFEIFKKAQLHVVQRRKGVQDKEELKYQQMPKQEDPENENVTTEVNLDIDISLKNDDKLQSHLEVISNIMRKLVKLGEESVLTLLNNIEHQITSYIQVQQDKVFNLDLFAPTSIAYKLLEILISNEKLKFTQPVTHRFEKLLELTFSLFGIYKANSKYFIITIHSSKDASEEKQVRRSSVLFTDLLDMLVSFCCHHLKALLKLGSAQYIQQALQLYQCLFTGQDAQKAEGEYFTLRERLRILNELNQIFNKIPDIVTNDYYWRMIREGLHDLDPYCRKVSMAVLKQNLKTIASADVKLYQNVMSKPDFEQMWTTFFDLYDTLESFGSHLTKAVWERTELFYAFIQKHYDKYAQLHLHPLVDFREWLMVLYKRVQNHMNLKLRRYVQKSTLKRKYMTTHMGEYVFDEFLKSLNKGLIFKDSNIYTQFSLKAELVNEFYQRYFTKECVDLSGDLSKFFHAFTRNVTHPQLLMCTMKNLARDYPSLKGIGPIEGFIRNEEIAKLYEMTSSYYSEQIYSSKYLCWKYMLQMLSLYTKANCANLNLTVLLKLIGKMPIEFFSNQAYSDTEGQKYAHVLIARFTQKSVIENIITSYINDLFQVKAIVQQMPKFGNEIDLVIQGVARLVLILSLPQQGQVSDPNNHQWFRDIMRPNWDSFQTILASSYLSPEVLDSKVRYLSVLLTTLYSYGDDGLKQTLRQDFIPRTLHLVTERLENNLLVPLTKYEQVQHQPSEMSKVLSLFAELTYYIKYLQISITACHIHLNQANSALEKTIKLILQMAIKIQAKASEKVQENVWSNFLTQYVVVRCLRVLTKCYASGIRKSLQKGITQLTVAEDLFSYGKPLLQGLVEFRQIPRPKESIDEISGEQKRFLIDNNLNLTNMQQEVLLNQWKALSELLQIFHFERQSREELLVGMYPLIAETAQDFLTRSTRPYLSSLFRVLKNTYIPVLLERIKATQDQNQITILIKDYQNTCSQCWSIIKELQTEFDAGSLQEFMEFTFNTEVMILCNSISSTIAADCQAFNDTLAADIFEQGNKYWLIMRTAFNHIMFIVSRRPVLLPQFVKHVANFTTCREVRSLDAELLLYKMNTLIPQIIPKAYENMNLEEITYQGAYIRTMTMIIIEELINRHKQHVQAGGSIDDSLISFTDGIEKLILTLIDLNYTIKYEKASMPYSDGHRTKVRAWQTILVCLEFIDPVKSIYNQAFREARQLQCGGSEDFIAVMNAHLWKVIGQNHLTSVRSYIEIVMVKFALMFPQYSVEEPTFVRTLLDPNVKANVASSHLVIAGFVMIKLSSNSQVLHNGMLLKQRLLEHMSGFLTSNGAHVRCVAQYFIHSLVQNDPQVKSMLPTGILPVIDYLSKNKDCLKVIKRYEEEISRIEIILDESSNGGASAVLSTPIDLQGEFLSKPFVERIKEVTSEVMSDIRNRGEVIHPTKRENLWMDALRQRKQEGEVDLSVNEESQSNYQRKILPWEQVEYDHDLLKRVYEGRARNEIIMCAVLIDKVPNLAGLARTSEIMNASALVINNRAVCDTDEFKGVSVTSEKWLPIYEVQETHLYKYLLYQKSNGYKILGLEQTANSKMLNEYKFPKKCVMLLGKEKEGIPQEYLSILDECIEIPQFGVIRSLNVHVSGALCLWEYTKQNLPINCSSKRE